MCASRLCPASGIETLNKRKLLRLFNMVLLITLCLGCGKEQQISAVEEPAVTDPPAGRGNGRRMHQYIGKPGKEGDMYFVYLVCGTDENGDEVTGKISMKHMQGYGTFENVRSEEGNVVVRLRANGELYTLHDDG